MALVLTRKRGQSIKVDGEAVFTIARAAKGVVKVIVEAPSGTRIIRAELEDRNNEESKTKDSTSSGKQIHSD